MSLTAASKATIAAKSCSQNSVKGRGGFCELNSAEDRKEKVEESIGVKRRVMHRKKGFQLSR
jgi:hypothetical protein